MATNGSLNSCVRWESNVTVILQDQTDVENVLKRSMKKWMDWPVGFDNSPFKEIKVQVVGQEVYTPSSLQGDTN